MKKLFKLLVLSSSILLIASCNLLPGKKDKSSSSDASSTQATQITSDTSGQQTDTSKDVTSHCEIVTAGASLPGSGVSWGVTDSNDHKTEFLNYLNTAAGLDIIKDYNDIANIFIQTHTGGTDKESCHLTIGTASYRGKLFLRTTKLIKKVAVTFSAYYKETATPQYEAGAKLNIEDTEFLPDISTSIPEPTKRVEYTYATPSDIVKLSNDSDHQRVFVDLIELYY